MSTYRWNLSDFAAGYDASAEHIHPYYQEMQDLIVDLLALPDSSGVLVVDVGGGSGRLMEKILHRWPHALGAVVDQSTAFLAIAERRMAPFGARAVCIESRLQDDWLGKLPQQPTAVVSMSAIHHLDPGEKHDLHERIYQSLTSGGQFLNGDEVLPAEPAEHRRLLETWSTKMQRGIDEGLISSLFQTALDKFVERNLTRFGEPKQSGDDCLQPIAEQLADYLTVGFRSADAPWQRDLWAVLRGMK